MTIFTRAKHFILTSIVIASFCSPTLAKQNPSIAFFYSNNNQVISIKKAYERLTSEEQRKLKRKAIDVLQSDHVEQGVFKNGLGTYTSSINGVTTADNSEIFFSSPKQNLSIDKIFTIAAHLAKKLNQESVAVFIPKSTETISHIKVAFAQDMPSISEVIKRIKNKLPESYRQSFTMHLIPTQQGYPLAKVNSVEWIGKNLDISFIRNSFPQEKLTSERGESYLVYQDGKYLRI